MPLALLTNPDGSPAGSTYSARSGWQPRVPPMSSSLDRILSRPTRPNYTGHLTAISIVPCACAGRGRAPATKRVYEIELCPEDGLYSSGAVRSPDVTASHDEGVRGATHHYRSTCFLAFRRRSLHHSYPAGCRRTSAKAALLDRRAPAIRDGATRAIARRNEVNRQADEHHRTKPLAKCDSLLEHSTI